MARFSSSEADVPEASHLRVSEAPLPKDELDAFSEHVNRELEEPFLPFVLDGRRSGDARFWAFRALVDGRLAATAWTGCANTLPSVSVLAGVVTANRYRRRGLARRICEEVVRWFMERGDGALYLAAASDGARLLYEQLGFQPIGGRAMVLETPGHNRLAGFVPGLRVRSRPANWGDISRVVPLFLWPHECVLLDAASGTLSPSVAPPARCVGIFWNIWRKSVAAGGWWRILENETGIVVGSAVAVPSGTTMTVDFAWHPNYDAKGRRFFHEFLSDTRAHFKRPIRLLLCEGDDWKRRELLLAGVAGERDTGRTISVGEEMRRLMIFGA